MYLLYFCISWYLLVGDWRQNANESVELQYRTDYQLQVMPHARYEKHETVQWGRGRSDEFGMNSARRFRYDIVRRKSVRVRTERIRCMERIGRGRRMDGEW